MKPVYRWFGKDPIGPLVTFVVKVEECSNRVPMLMEAFFEGDYEGLSAYADEIRRLEHEADILKNEARDRLPRSVFLPFDRRDMLDVLSSFDAIADCAEDVAALFTIRRMEPHEELIGPLKSLVRGVTEVVREACAIIYFLEPTFGKRLKSSDIRVVIQRIEHLSDLEHEADIVQDELAKRLFAIEANISAGSLIIWNKISNKIGDMANHAERGANRLRLFFAE